MLKLCSALFFLTLYPVLFNTMSCLVQHSVLSCLVLLTPVKLCSAFFTSFNTLSCPAYFFTLCLVLLTSVNTLSCLVLLASVNTLTLLSCFFQHSLLPCLAYSSKHSFQPSLFFPTLCPALATSVNTLSCLAYHFEHSCLVYFFPKLFFFPNLLTYFFCRLGTDWVCLLSAWY